MSDFQQFLDAFHPVPQAQPQGQQEIAPVTIQGQPTPNTINMDPQVYLKKDPIEIAPGSPGTEISAIRIPQSPTEAEEATEGNLDQQKKVIEEKAVIDKETADRNAAVLAVAANDHETLKTQMDLASTQAQTQHEEDHTRMISAYNDAAKNQMDPNHWWNSRSTGGKIAAALGILGGAVAMPFLQQANPGRNPTNPVLEQINGYIKEDIESQKDNIANAWEKYKTAHGIEESDQSYANFKANFIGKQMDLGRQVVEDELKSIAAHAANPVAANQAKMALVEIDKQRQDSRNALMQLNMKSAAAQAAALRAEMLREVQRQQAIEDAATKHKNEMELEAAKATSTEEVQSASETRKSDLASGVKSKEQLAFLEMMHQKAENGESPSIDDKKAAEKLGIALPEGSTGVVFGKNKETLNKQYGASKKVITAGQYPSYFKPDTK